MDYKNSKNRYPQNALSRPMAQGYTYEDIEQWKHLKVVDHLGNRYKSKAAIAKAYGISKFVFDKREKSGWSLEKVLTTPTDTKNSRLTGWSGQMHDFQGMILFLSTRWSIWAERNPDKRKSEVTKALSTKLSWQKCSCVADISKEWNVLIKSKR